MTQKMLDGIKPVIKVTETRKSQRLYIPLGIHLAALWITDQHNHNRPQDGLKWSFWIKMELWIKNPTKTVKIAVIVKSQWFEKSSAILDNFTPTVPAYCQPNTFPWDESLDRILVAFKIAQCFESPASFAYLCDFR